MSEPSSKALADAAKWKLNWEPRHFFKEYGIVIALLLIIGLLSIISPSFLTFNNIMNVLRQVSINGLLAIGATFVILTRGIDLSVGSILAFSGVVTASLVQGGAYPDWIAILAGLFAGLMLGLVNGIVVAKWYVAPFIVTLGMMSAARGLTFVYSDGRPIPGLSESFKWIGGGTLIGVPVPVWVLLFVFALSWFVLYRTRIGRYVYAVGGNEESALISGVNVKRVKIIVYSISGLLAGLAGIILTSRVTSGLPQAGSSYELDAIAAVVIGGTSLAGGKGRLWGTMIGVLLIGVINNGLDLLNVSSYYQLIVKGLVIVVAVLIDSQKSQRA